MFAALLHLHCFQTYVRVAVKSEELFARQEVVYVKVGHKLRTKDVLWVPIRLGTISCVQKVLDGQAVQLLLLA